MEKEIKIQRRVQDPSEPYCGTLTYCALTNTDPSQVKELHAKGAIKPSIGFFYTSFLKLDKRTKAHIERAQNMLSASDTECFDTMWKFEEPFQKISKREFISQVLDATNEIYQKHKKRIHQYGEINPEISSRIIRESVGNGNPVGVLIMEDINQHTKQDGKFMIPHWITIHGISDKRKEFLVSNTYHEKSEWISQKELLERISATRNHGFSPQLVTI